MKKQLSVLLLIGLLILSACAAPKPDGTQTFTLEELAQYDGQNGAKAYVAVNGKVYDVTGVDEWTNGSHNGNLAGQDLTEAIKLSPHGTSKLNNLPVVGTLVN